MLRVWLISTAVWTCIATALGTTDYLSGIPMGTSGTYFGSLVMQFGDCFTYLPMTPFAYWLANRYPVERENWGRRIWLLLGGGLLFTLSHVLLRGLTPYGDWDSASRHWKSAVDWSAATGLQIHWRIYAHMLIVNPIEDLIFNYAPIALIGLAVAYHQSFRQNELRKVQLESHLATARLEALKSQLRPHFLFNTLHSISSLMFTDVAAADQMMSLLSDLLRQSLRNSESQVTTLRDELQFVDTYLEIESIRFESRLTIERDIAPDTLGALVPYLVLQPLVENAVRHGVARMASGGRIRIASSHVGGHLLLQVTDNGPGIQSLTASSSRTGLGLSSTHERLRTLYGDEQRMEIHAAADGGTTVQIHLPLTLSNAAPSETEVLAQVEST